MPDAGNIRHARNEYEYSQPRNILIHGMPVCQDFTGAKSAVRFARKMI
jgi:hypothetical protein